MEGWDGILPPPLLYVEQYSTTHARLKGLTPLRILHRCIPRSQFSISRPGRLKVLFSSLSSRLKPNSKELIPALIRTDSCLMLFSLDGGSLSSHSGLPCREVRCVLLIAVWAGLLVRSHEWKGVRFNALDVSLAQSAYSCSLARSHALHILTDWLHLPPLLYVGSGSTTSAVGQ